MKISSHDRKVEELLSGHFFTIPRFQRPYSWDREIADEFWNDTMVEREAETDYFIGSLVVYRPERSNGPYWVVDGQQRLTTIAMLLCAIRNAMTAEGLKAQAKGIHSLVERTDLDDQLQFVLDTEGAHPFLQQVVFKGVQSGNIAPESREEDGIAEVFTHLTRRVGEVVDAIKANPALPPKKRTAAVATQLKQLRDRVLTLKAILIQLDNEDDAYVVFETLNTRGKDLRPADLVKNFLTKLIKPSNKGLDLPKQRWEKILDLLAASEVDLDPSHFLHRYWLSKHDYVTEKKLFKSIKRRIKKEDAESFLEELVRDSSTYRTIFEPTYRKWKPEESDVKNALEALSVFNVQQPTPLVLSLLRGYLTGTLKLARVKQTLRVIETFHFKFTAIVQGHASGGTSKRYATTAQKIAAATKPDDAYKEMFDLEKKLKAGLPDFAEFESGFLKLQYSDVLKTQKKLVHYALRGLYQAAAAGGGVPVDFEKMTIEHLAPQSTSPTTVSAAHVAGIGNLLLVDQKTNEALADKPFEEKKKILAKSSLGMRDAILAKNTWGEADIEERAKALASAAFEQAWKI